MRQVAQWRWHLDEVYAKISGEMHNLRRAVDHEGELHESYATKTRDKAAALSFLKRMMKRHGKPKAIVTDRLRSDGAALKELGKENAQQCGRWLNNRADGTVKANLTAFHALVRAEIAGFRLLLCSCLGLGTFARVLEASRQTPIL